MLFPSQSNLMKVGLLMRLLLGTDITVKSMHVVCVAAMEKCNAQWNVHGFGRMDAVDAWLPEQSFVSTIMSTISVKHSGSGGHSFKQESIGPAVFYYHDVLNTMHAFVNECLNEHEVAVGWV